MHHDHARHPSSPDCNLAPGRAVPSAVGEVILSPMNLRLRVMETRFYVNRDRFVARFVRCIVAVPASCIRIVVNRALARIGLGARRSGIVEIVIATDSIGV